MNKKEKTITRKDFIKKSSAGIIGSGIIALNPSGLSFSLPGLAEGQIGNTGIETTSLGIGATRTQEPAIIKAALEGGIRFFDTGRIYAGGKNEEMIGRVVKGLRKEIIIQSKVLIMEEAISEKLRNETRQQVVNRIFKKSLEESLDALQTDYIDIMLFHGGSNISPLFDEEILNAFNQAKKEGKIRATGFSTHSNMAELVAYNNAHPCYDVILVAFNHSGGYTHSNYGGKYDWDQETLVKELKTAAASGTGIVAMKTCSGGPFSVEPDREPSLPQAVKWVLMQDFIHTAVPAMASFSQVESHIQENKVYSGNV